MDSASSSASVCEGNLIFNRVERERYRTGDVFYGLKCDGLARGSCCQRKAGFSLCSSAHPLAGLAPTYLSSSSKLHKIIKLSV